MQDKTLIRLIVVAAVVLVASGVTWLLTRPEPLEKATLQTAPPTAAVPDISPSEQLAGSNLTGGLTLLMIAFAGALYTALVLKKPRPAPSQSS